MRFFKSTSFPSRLCGRNLCSCPGPGLGVGVAVTGPGAGAGAGPSTALGLDAGEEGVDADADADALVAPAAPGVPGRLGGGRERRTASSCPRYTTCAEG